MKKAYILAGTYLIFGCLWIYFSDLVLFELVDEPEKMHKFENYKGIFFVLVSSILIFFIYNILNATIEKQKSALEKTSNEMKMILDHTEELIGLVEVQKNGAFVYIRGNKALYDLYEKNQIELDDFLQRELIEHHNILAQKGLHTQPEFLEEQYRKVVKTKKPVKFELLYKLEDNESRLIIMRLSPIIDKSGKVKHILFVSDDITEQAKLYREKTYSQIQMLSTQLNPHFIFNALSSVQFFILEEKTESAINYLSSFSSLMRKTLNNSLKRFIPLDKEIEFLKEYVSLEIERKHQKVTFKVELSLNDFATDEICIPPMLLQPFVENAFVHGFSNNGENKELSITFKVEDEEFICYISDNGIGRKKVKENIPVKSENNKSHGMRLVNERLRLLNDLYNDAFQISIIDKDPEKDQSTGTTVKINMPLLHDGELDEK